MKVELYIEGPEVSAVFAAFVPQYQKARAADEAAWHAKIRQTNTTDTVATAASELEPAPAPAAEPEKPKRGRPPKAAEPAKEPEPSIRATPEDRKPAEEIEDAEVVAEETPPKVYTREDLRAALAAYVEVVGMARANDTKGALLGYPKFSEVPEDPKAFEAAVVRINKAIEKERAIND